ncbi:MAG: tRNA (N6-isopentenyl adenosine(37)-C2)-methylthiotransferase MiaB [Candidatus Omnitrophica bacterium]|nr:tRNA (N6-isopentenyl adenosine(37)-C2)-methylthiotransferase MiaB [Candidatus Omnitrophota bacterium]
MSPKCPAVYLKTFGCQMNIRDSEFVTGLLLDDGFRMVDSPEAADVIIFNSCSVRKHAEERLFGNICDLAGLKKKRPGLIIGLMGCTAQNYKDEALTKAPMLDFVCGTGNEKDLPQLVGDILKDRCRIVAADKVNEKKPEPMPEYREGTFKAYVAIGEGCDNFCSYCIVPYVRGRERSRRAEDIIKEVKDLAVRGFKEITLLGQNVNSYKLTANRSPLTAKTSDFVRLLEQINSIKGIERIRFMTSHPKDASVELFKAMRDLDKVCEHLHLPLQSGSDRILNKMSRGYTQKKYLELAGDYKKTLPEGSLTTDILVGFPSETEKDFKATVMVMEKVGFDSAFTFKYSPRPPARSCALKDDVKSEVKEKRLKTIIDIQCKISEVRNRALVGKTLEVLVDGHGGRDPHKLTGRTRTNKTAIFSGDGKLTGRSVNVKIGSVTPYALLGRMA